MRVGFIQIGVILGLIYFFSLIPVCLYLNSIKRVYSEASAIKHSPILVWLALLPLIGLGIHAYWLWQHRNANADMPVKMREVLVRNANLGLLSATLAFTAIALMLLVNFLLGFLLGFPAIVLFSLHWANLSELSRQLASSTVQNAGKQNA